MPSGVRIEACAFDDTPLELRYSKRYRWSCETETSYDNNVHVEKTQLKFRTTDEIPMDKNIAFIVEDVEKVQYLIGVAEAPYPVVECSHELSEDTKIREYKVKYIGIKSIVII